LRSRGGEPKSHKSSKRDAANHRAFETPIVQDVVDLLDEPIEADVAQRRLPPAGFVEQ
jgi:hypothetical protein